MVFGKSNNSAFEGSMCFLEPEHFYQLARLINLSTITDLMILCEIFLVLLRVKLTKINLTLLVAVGVHCFVAKNNVVWFF